MSNFDTIASSVKSAWAASDTALMPAANIYYDRAQKPNLLAGFPYAELFLEVVELEVMTVVDENTLVTYLLTVKIWTCQGMTGGTTTGEQLTDQANLIRAFEAILNTIPPNTAWDSVTDFLHCIKDGGGKPLKDEELYQGKDVYKSESSWRILVTE